MNSISQKPAKKPEKKRRRIRRSKNSKNYFTKVHEDAIVAYNEEGITQEKKEHLYNNIIRPAMDQLVDKIVFTYKFTTLPNIDILRSECKVWLVTVFCKFDPSKGSKAFSYFSVITKNWFIQKVKKNQKKNRREIDLENMSREIELEHLSVTNTYDEDREKDEFWSHLNEEIKHWDTGNLKENEKKVLEAIKILLESPEDIEIFNKKAVYMYMREITGLNTKQVVNSLNKMRKRYKTFKIKWDKGDV